MMTRELGAFVEVEIAGDVLVKTNSKYDSRRNPVWNESFVLDVCHHVKDIKLRVCASLHVVATLSIVSLVQAQGCFLSRWC
jgi:hypothetical protein